MKKTLAIIIVLLLTAVLSAEGGMVMAESDWLHMTIPLGVYVISNQLADYVGINRQIAGYSLLGLGCVGILAWEYSDYCGHGACTKEDIELGLTSLAIGYVVNKSINAIKDRL